MTCQKLEEEVLILFFISNHTSEWITQVAKDKRKTGAFNHAKTVKIILSELSHATQQL